VLNYFSERVNSSTAVHAMKERLEDLRGKANVAKTAQILPARIREAVATDRSAERGLPVVLSDPSSGIAEDFEKLARWLDQHP
jgi:cellulose biosynthesis protein BcsQ